MKKMLSTVPILMLFASCETASTPKITSEPGLPASVECNYEAPETNQTYDELKAEIEKVRLDFATRFETENKDSVISEAGTYLFKVIENDLFAHWYGTKWNFNGTTHKPHQGTIACGYFITTILEDAGLKIPRTYWAQQASEYYITHMTSDVKRFSNAKLADVANYFDSREDGLYIVGLDNHVGFVVKKDNCLRFVHASYYDPEKGVQSEKLNSKNPFSVSAYRVVGRILGKEMVEKWILGTKWEK